MSETLWRSECGRFWAYLRPEADLAVDHHVACDVVHVETGRVWLAHRYRPTSLSDEDPRATHVPFPRCVTSSGPGGRTGSFELGITSWSVPLPRSPYPAQTTSISHQRVTFRLRVRRSESVAVARGMVAAALAAFEGLPRSA